jgi:hypothetical protein
MRNLFHGVALLGTVLMWPAPSRADFVFTSQPVNGHVVQFWLGVSAMAGGAAMQVDMSNPNRPVVSVDGSTGEHMLRFGVNIDGQPADAGRAVIASGYHPQGYIDAIRPGNPGGYWAQFNSGYFAAEMFLQGTTSPGAEVLDAQGGHTHSYRLEQPGFPAAGYAIFHTTGMGATFSLDVVLHDYHHTPGAGYPRYGPLAWTLSEEVTPDTRLPHLPEPASLGLFGLGLLLGVPLWLRKGTPRTTPAPA